MVKVRGHGSLKHASREEDVRKLIAVLGASAMFMLGPAAPLAGAWHGHKHPPHPGNNKQGQQQQQQQAQGQSQSQCILVLGLLMPATC